MHVYMYAHIISACKRILPHLYEYIQTYIFALHVYMHTHFVHGKPLDPDMSDSVYIIYIIYLSIYFLISLEGAQLHKLRLYIKR
jgi:hypothetical protein